MAQQPENEPECGGARPLQRQNRMTCHARKQRPGTFSDERLSNKARGGSYRVRRESAGEKRMMGEVNRSENIRCQVVPLLYESREETDICSRVFAEISRGICDRSLENDGVATIKRMCDSRFRKDPF